MSRLPLAYFALVLFIHAASSEAGVRCPRSRSDPIPTQCPVLNPETGHAYLVGFGDDGPLGWYDARDAAASLSFQGMTGHLATITSQAEQDFLERRFILGGSESDLWLGASDAAVEGEWRWVVGPEAGEMFWQGGLTEQHWAMHPGILANLITGRTKILRRFAMSTTGMTSTPTSPCTPPVISWNFLRSRSREPSR